MCMCISIHFVLIKAIQVKDFSVLFVLAKKAKKLVNCYIMKIGTTETGFLPKIIPLKLASLTQILTLKITHQIGYLRCGRDENWYFMLENYQIILFLTSITMSHCESTKFQSSTLVWKILPSWGQGAKLVWAISLRGIKASKRSILSVFLRFPCTLLYNIKITKAIF